MNREKEAIKNIIDKSLKKEINIKEYVQNLFKVSCQHSKNFEKLSDDEKLKEMVGYFTIKYNLPKFY